MNRFYGDNLNGISSEILLEANPFHKDPRINFLGNLTPEIFFNNFYVDSIDISEQSQNKEIIQFTSGFNETINTTTQNRFAKVDLIHISGYGGCGKTTFIRYLLWSKFKDYSLKYVIDFAGEQHIEDVYIFALSNLIYKNFYCSKILEWDALENLKIFETRRFGNIIPRIFDIVSKIKKLESQKSIDKSAIIDVLSCYKKTNFEESKVSYIGFLLRFYFLIQLLESIYHNSKPMVVVFDNVDSIDNIEEERNFVLELKDFITDCNYFFGLNRSNCNKINSKPISEITTSFKMICFLTTRIVTIKKFIELSPDMEEMYGWKSFRLPENYFNHVAIIDRRINYYLSDNKVIGTPKHLELTRLKNFTHIIYRANIVSKLFNGNIRFTMKTICNINKYYHATEIPIECSNLFNYKMPHNDNVDGAIGMILSLLLNYFKDNNIYSKKLHLSNCLPDNHITLSRMILTILREKNGVCSIIEIFDCLYPFFDIKDICETLYDMSETKRDVWRRLLIFSRNFPEHGVDDLYIQMDLYTKGDRATEKYSIIELCAAGEAYLDIIVPHFEFMLSRHSDYEYSTNSNYHPLFSKSSEEYISSSNVDIRYRFERKIDWVYNDVKDCCKNCRGFSTKVMREFEWDDNQYLNYSVYNYRSRYNDGTFGYKQDYVSRLIFGHIGYIERYRRYLLAKLKNSFSTLQLIDINKRLVIRIKRYLNLYLDPQSKEYDCCHSSSQDEAAISLSKCIKRIEDSKYIDFQSSIEIIR